jgi:hypothetical protein
MTETSNSTQRDFQDDNALSNSLICDGTLKMEMGQSQAQTERGFSLTNCTKFMTEWYSKQVKLCS